MPESRRFWFEGRWYSLARTSDAARRPLAASEAESLLRRALRERRIRSLLAEAILRGGGPRGGDRLFAAPAEQLDRTVIDAVRRGELIVVEHLEAKPKLAPGPIMEAPAPIVPAPVEPEEPIADEPTPIVVFLLAGPLACGVMLAGPSAPIDTLVASPLPAGVVGRLAKWGDRPPPESLIQVGVIAATQDEVTLSCDAGSTTLTLGGTPGSPGRRTTEKWILPWYGEAGDLQGAAWDDVELFEVTAGGSLPFATSIEATCGAGKRKLGLIDVIYADPDSGTGRSARYGVFRTRTPSATFVLPELEHDRLKFVLDDGYDDTDDRLDVTALLGVSGPETSLDLPGWVTFEGGPCSGRVNQAIGRSRMVVEEEQPAELGGDCAILMFGENRLRIYLDDALIYCAHSFHYTEAEQIIPAGHNPGEVVETDEGPLELITGGLLLDFVEGTDDATISTFLHAARLRATALADKEKIVEARTHDALGWAELDALIEKFKTHEDTLEDLGPAPLGLPDPEDEHAGVLEAVPDALHADFVAANDTFTNAATHWHHFVIHTFAAHRLIEQVLLPHARPPLVSLSGVQFATNKTFVNPAAFDGLRRIRELAGEDPARKLAIFGHTDRVGDDAYNEGLSLMRARSVDALLRNHVGFWHDRFGQNTEAVGSAIADQQWALERTGHYAGPIDGNQSPTFTAAVQAFQSARGIPQGPVNWTTRDELGKALREHEGAIGELLEFEDPWATRELQAMLQFLGLYAGPVDGVARASYVQAVRDFQAGKSIGVDGQVGLVTRVALIDDYQKGMVIEPFADDRMHVGAVFGCGEAFPKIPTADGVESQPNRRVEVVFRREAVLPIDPANQHGATVPYVDWLRPEQPAGGGPTLPQLVVAVGDTGFANGDDYRGDLLEQRNRMLIRGDRWIRPTDAAGANAGNPNVHTVAGTGDLRGVVDTNGHGTCVISCMASDGIGDPIGGAPRAVRTAVLGTAPHIKVRAVRLGSAFGYFNVLLVMEIVASDPDVKVYSTSCHLYRVDQLTTRQQRALQERLQEMINHGKIALATAGNYRQANHPGRYDTASREYGSQAADRGFPRSHASYTGIDAHRPKVAIVGSSAEVSATGTITAPGQRDTVAGHTYLGEQVSWHMPGENIRAVTVPAAGVGVGANGLNIRGIGGTSFACPMSAGVVGELMLLDADLQQPANQVRAFEYIEATADPLPNVAPAGGQGAPAAPRSADPGAAAGGPPSGPQLPTVAATYQNIRRVHFWKAALAAVNKGLSNEGRGADGASDAFFTACTLRGDANTNWYGFEVRTPTPNAVLYWRKPDGSMNAVEDFAAHLPGDVTMASTWRLVDLPELAAGQPLPAFPFTRANFTAAGRTPYYMAQVSIHKDDLARYQSLVVHLPQIDPLDPEGAAGPPVVDIRVDDRAALRDPAAQAGSPDLGKQAIATFVRFSDFVFRVTAVPEPIASFQMIAQDRRSAAGVGETIEVRLFAVDRFGFLARMGAVATNVTHDGTPGASVPANAGVFLAGAPAAQAGVPPVFGAGTDHPGMARIQFQGFTSETVTLRFDDGAGHTGSLAIEVHPAGPIAAFRCELRRRGGGASVVDQPLAVGEAFELEVSAVDAGGITVSGFTGKVTLSLVSNEAGVEGPPRRGLHVKNADADPHDPARMQMNLAAGVGVFPLFCYTTGDLQLKVEDAASHTGQSRAVRIVAGALTQLRVQATTPQKVGNRFGVIVTALDASGNVLSNFEGPVLLALMPGQGTVGAVAGDGTRSGVLMGDTLNAADDTFTYDHADEGTHEFTIAAYTAETIRLRATSGAITGDSDPVIVQANAIDHFELIARGASRAGTRFELEVLARDAANATVTGYAGNVTLSVAQGTAFVAGPTPRGVRLETAQGTIGNVHAYASADHGRFVFFVTPFSVETIRLQASDGAVTSQSAALAIESGAATSLQVTPAGASVPRNQAFAITVSALDTSNNVVPGFVGTVTLTFTRNGGGVQSFAPAQTQTFTAANGGRFTFNVRFARRGQHVVTASDGNLRATSFAINVT
ncbi:peptidoglycan-binding protein [Nannocystaceae bacterium ST9]